MAGLTQPSSRALRRRGVKGEASVSLQGSALVFTGKRGGEMHVTVADVERLRAGREQSRHGPLYYARLWLAGDKRPVEIWVNRSSMADYTAVMRGFAAAMAEAGKLDRLERGTTKASAVAMLVLMGLLTLAALGVSIFVLAREPWYLRFLPVAVPAALTVAGFVQMRQDLPAPVASLEEFNAAAAGTRR